MLFRSNQINEKILKKIREEIINKGREKPKDETAIGHADHDILKSAGIEILDQNQKELPAPHPLVMQKLSGPLQSGKKKTEYSFSNMSSSLRADVPIPPKPAASSPPAKNSYSLNGDPYRVPPEA